MHKDTLFSVGHQFVDNGHGVSQADSRDLLSQVGFIVLLLFGYSSFISKAATDFFLLTACLMSFVWLSNRQNRFSVRNSFLMSLMALLFLGIVCSFFSAAGFSGGLLFLRRFRFLLIFFPLTCFVGNLNQYKILYLCLVLSALTAVVYGVISIPQDLELYANFQGFHKIGRTADMLLVMVIATTGYVFYKVRVSLWGIKTRVFLASTTLLFLGALLLTSMRGSWLGMCVGLIFFGVTFNRKFLLGITLATVLAAGLMQSADLDLSRTLTKQIQSIVSPELVENVQSNTTRFHLWKVGLDFSQENFFFGTGAKNTEKLYQRFFSSRSLDYQKKYHYAGSHSHDFHNSYLQILIECGLVFFFFSVVFFLKLQYKILRSVKSVDEKGKVLLVSAVVASAGFLTAQFFHSDLYSYGSIPFLIVLFGGIVASEKASFYA